MSKYTHISSATTTTLVSKSIGLTSINSATNRRGFNRLDISKISITNFDTTAAGVKVFLDGITKAIRTVNQTTGTGATIIFDQENVVSRGDLIEVGDELVDGADSTPHGVVTVVNTSGNTKQITRTTSSTVDDNQTINFKRPDHYITGSITIPAGVTLVLDDPFSFNLYQHELKVTNTTSGTAKLTIRIN
jgi:hypothetical protein